MAPWLVLCGLIASFGLLAASNGFLRTERQIKKAPCPKVDFSRNELSCPNPALTGCPRNYPYGDPVPCMTDLDCPCSAICCNFGKRCPQQCWMNTTVPQQAGLQGLQSNKISTFHGGEDTPQPRSSGSNTGTKKAALDGEPTPMLIVLPVWTISNTGQLQPLLNSFKLKSKSKETSTDEKMDLSDFFPSAKLQKRSITNYEKKSEQTVMDSEDVFLNYFLRNL